MDTIEDKLSAIDSKMAGLEAKMCVLTTRQDECERKAQDALESVSFLSTEIEKHDATHKESESHIDTVRKDLLYLNCYSRRENLIFFGITEKKDEDVAERVYSFMENNLGIEDAERADRVPKNLQIRKAAKFKSSSHGEIPSLS